VAGFLLFTPPGHEGFTLPISITSTDELGNRLFQTHVKTALNRVQYAGIFYHEVLLLEYRAGRVLNFSCSTLAGCRDAACTANGPSESYVQSGERRWVEHVPRTKASDRSPVLDGILSPPGTTAELRETVRSFKPVGSRMARWNVCRVGSTHQKLQDVESLAWTRFLAAAVCSGYHRGRAGFLN